MDETRSTHLTPEIVSFGRLTALDLSGEVASEATGIRTCLRESGGRMSPRGLLIVAAARPEGQELIVTDVDFDTEGVDDPHCPELWTRFVPLILSERVVISDRFHPTRPLSKEQY